MFRRPLLLSVALMGCAETTCPPGSSRWDDGLCHLDDFDPDGEVGDAADGDGDADLAERLPDWSAEEAEDELQAALRWGIPSATELTDVFLGLMAYADDECPGGHGFSLESPDDTCTAESGAEFYGYGTWHAFMGESEAGAPLQSSAMGQASFTIRTPEGRLFQAGGGWGHALEGTEAGGDSFHGFVTGSFAFEDDPAWLGHDVSLSYNLTGTEVEGITTAAFSGGAAVDGHAYWIEDLTLDDDTCDGVPQMDLRIRHPDGPWAGVTLGEDCGTCGTLSWLDAPEVELGELCVELKPDMETLIATVTP